MSIAWREMRPQRTGLGDPLGPVHDERVARAAEMRADLLSPLKRRVARPRPRRGVVRIHHRAAPRVDASVALRELELHLVAQRDPVLHRQLVERAGDRALHAGAVIPPDPQHERVLQLAELIDRVDHPADVVIGVLGEARVHLHLPGVKRLQLVRDVVPRRERLIARRQLRIGRDHPERLLPGERLLTQLVPALVELALVLRRPLLGHMMRGVAAARGEVREERLLRVLPADRVQPLDRLVRHRIGQVVRVLLVVELRRSADDLLVLGQARIPLRRPPAEEPIEVLKPPTDRPAIKRPRRALLTVRRQMPLTERRRAVPVVPQNPRERNAIIRNERRVAGEPGRELADRTKPNRMTVATRQQRRPRRRAQRRDVEPVIPHTLLRDPRVIRGVDRPAERSGIPEPGIIDQHQQHVRRAVGRLDVTDRLPVRLRAPKRPVRHAPERCLRIGSLLRSGWLINWPPGRLASMVYLFKNSRRSFQRSVTPSSPDSGYLEGCEQRRAAHARECDPWPRGSQPPSWERSVIPSIADA